MQKQWQDDWWQDININHFADVLHREELQQISPDKKLNKQKT